MDSEDQINHILGLDGEVIPAGARTAPSLMGGAHEAADRYSREMATWAPRVQSADADILPDKVMADARTLDLMRNDAFVAAGATLHKDNIVGAMFLLNAKPNGKVLGKGFDDTWATEFQEEVESKFTLWAESFNNWPDAARRNTFTSMIRLAVGVYVASGEVLATVEWLRDSPRPYSTAFQMIELSRLSNPQNIAFDANRTRGGIHFNSYGAPIGYHIRRGMPGMADWRGESWEWSYVRAKNRIGRPQVIHIMEQQRPNQSRGISQLTAALKEMRITKRFREVTLQNAVVNASFAAAIESELPTQAIFESLGGGNVGEQITGYASQFLGAISQYADNARNMQIDGVKIPHLMPGTKLQLMPMGTPGGVGTDFESSLLRYIAANLDVSYEQLSKDYRETNYSSARAGMVETWKAMQSRKRMVADRIATMKYRLWFEEALDRNEITSLPRNAPNFYEGLNMEAYTRCEWIGAGRGQVDELKETQAAILRLKQGIGTYEDELGKQGKDWRAVFAQLKRERELMTEYGIEPQEDNAINAVSGDPREANEGEPDEPRGTKKK